MNKFDKFVTHPETALAILKKLDGLNNASKKDAKAVTKEEETFRELVKAEKKDYIGSLLSCLSDVEWVKEKGKVSPSLTLEGIIGDERIILSILGLMYPKTHMKPLTKNPKYSAFTPLAMYAAKLYADIPYSDWNCQDPYIRFFLGKHLTYLYKYRNGYNNTLEGKELRKVYQKPKPVCWQAFKDKAEHFSRIFDTSGQEDLVLEPSEQVKLIHMVAQYWLANVKYRDTDTMILDPWNWDRIPPALDETVMEAIVQPKKTTKLNDRKGYIDDLPF